MTHVLVIEDDPSLRRSLSLNLTARGYTVDETGNGEDALRLAGRRLPDVVFVDLGLPTMPGLEVIRSLRGWAEIPIIVLSARGAETDKVEALDAGANDYVTKPFGIEELMARLRAAERTRASQRPDDGPTVTPHFAIDHQARTVRSAVGEQIHLTPIEWALLAHLSQRSGQLVTHTELLRAVWGPEYTKETNYLRVHITHLRKKIEPDPSHPIYVTTEPGVGYRFTFEP
jgi:two-component system, OmpR family, KDP operon response regulator KdpE